MEPIVFDPEHIGFKQVHKIRGTAEDQKPMRDEPLTPQLGGHFLKRRLVLVERDEAHFRLNHRDVLQLLSAVLQNHQFRALAVHLQEVDVVNVQVV